MSTKPNEEWLAAAQENFQGALDEGNYLLAKAVIADTFDRGFQEAARQMTDNLRNTPAENFRSEIDL